MTQLAEGLQLGADGIVRCWWPDGLEDYTLYHDTEWGYPVKDDFRLFEKICLEGFQSGLSWLTVLRKREDFRRVFHHFDFHRVAQMTSEDVERLLQDASIIRHRRKIESTINNAQHAVKMAEEFGSLAKYFWSFEPPATERPPVMDYAHLRHLAHTPSSTAMSKDLKKRGWSFVGPTTAYAFMQAMGLVNDHLEGCYFREVAEQARKDFQRP